MCFMTTNPRNSKITLLSMPTQSEAILSKKKERGLRWLWSSRKMRKDPRKGRRKARRRRARERQERGGAAGCGGDLRPCWVE